MIMVPEFELEKRFTLAETSGPWRRIWTRITSRIAASILVVGFLLDYTAQQHTFGKWPDLFLPSVAFLFASTAVVLFFVGLRFNSPRRGIQKILLISLVISVPLTSMHATLYAITKMSERGRDRYGQCSQIVEVANATEVIPESPVFPGQPTADCGNFRHGMLLMPYYELSVWGVTESGEQARVMQGLTNYRSSSGVLPIRVKFYAHYNWIQHPGWGERGQPERLLRVVYLK